MRKTILLAAAATAAAIAAAPASAQTQTIFLEDFEGAPPYEFTFVGNVDVSNGNNYNACCGTSGSAAALANNFAAFGDANQPSGLIFRDIATQVGQTYTIRFDYGALGNTGLRDPLTLSVGSGPGSISQSFTATPNNNLDETFTRGFLTFTATSATTNFGFSSNGVNNVDAVLDNVRFSSGGVPEPATWALMILGFGAVGGAMRRRKAQVAFA